MTPSMAHCTIAIALWATNSVILLRSSPNSRLAPGDFVGCDIILGKRKSALWGALCVRFRISSPLLLEYQFAIGDCAILCINLFALFAETWRKIALFPLLTSF